MKKRLLAILLTLVMVAALLPTASASTVPTQEQAYKSMIALKSSYPEGLQWTNDNYYAWKGGIFSGGHGCAGFAFMLSDAAFGSLPARKLTAFQYSDIKVGDILRVNNDTHSVIILEVHENNVILAEGNYNSSVHWGRSLSRQEVMNATYLMTRYPEQPAQPALPAVEAIAATGTAVPTPQTVKLDGKDVVFQTYAVKDAKGNDTNYVKIRDLALALNGTKAQFSVGWNGSAVVIDSGKAYAPDGSEYNTPYSGNQPYHAVSNDPVSFNGSPVNLTSFRITHEGKGYTYYKLRDLGQLLNFNVKWEGGAVIETGKPFTGK